MPVGVSAYTALANVTLGSSAASVTFSSISGSYRDLVLVVSMRSTRAVTTDFPALRINTDTGSSTSCSSVVMNGDGNIAASFTTSGVSEFAFMEVPGANATANVFSMSRTNFMDYSATDKHKTILNRWDNPLNYNFALAGRWNQTTAITGFNISFPYTAAQIAAGSTFALYGIAS